MHLVIRMVGCRKHAGGGQIFIMDSCIGIGITSEALREGADCPVDATFVPVTAANSRWNVRPAPVQVALPAGAAAPAPLRRPASRVHHAKI